MSMSKRARYDGPHDEVLVDLSEGDINRIGVDYVTVKRGGLLPAEVPAKIRDELLSNPDWSPVEQASGKKEN